MQAEQDQLCKEINWQNYTNILDLDRKRTFTLPWTFYRMEITKEFSNAHPPYLHEKGEEEAWIFLWPVLEQLKNMYV